MTESKTIIAVVDDDPIVRLVSKTVLENQGWMVHEYSSGTAFLESADSVYTDTPPSCLILDFHLGDMNALDVQKYLADIKLKIPTIIVTAAPDDPLVPRTVENGALLVIPKPTKPRELVQVVREVVAGNLS